MKEYKIEILEGIGPVFSEKLKSIGINTTSNLLENAKTPAQRKHISEKLDISGKLILKFVQMAELSQIEGVGEEYSELLEVSGINNTVELSLVDSKSLVLKMQEVNDEKQLVRKLPTVVQVENWVAESITIPTQIEY